MTRLFAIVPYRMFMGIVVGSSILFGMVLALAVRSAAKTQPGLMPLVTIWIPLLMLVITVPILTLLTMPWVYLRDMELMLAGTAWAHWTYDEAAWAHANALEGARLRRTAYVGALFLLAGSVVMLVASLVLSGGAGSALRFAGDSAPVARSWPVPP